MTTNELPGPLVLLIGLERELALLAYVDCGQGQSSRAWDHLCQALRIVVRSGDTQKEWVQRF